MMSRLTSWHVSLEWVHADFRYIVVQSQVALRSRKLLNKQGSFFMTILSVCDRRIVPVGVGLQSQWFSTGGLQRAWQLPKLIEGYQDRLATARTGH
jgi:hypothetical protein